jgi:glutathione S-transferase
MKALITLYENETPFEPHFVDLGNPSVRAAFTSLSPIGKMPVLRDRARNRVVAESSIVIEYLALHHPGKIALVPSDVELALEVRKQDRFYDLYVMEPMQRIVGDRLRPAGKSDAYGVEKAKEALAIAYGIVETDMAAKTWAAGGSFTMADCAAAPALFYANEVLPLGEAHRNAAAYLGRLRERPSFARVLAEAQPYFANFPREKS